MTFPRLALPLMALLLLTPLPLMNSRAAAASSALLGTYWLPERNGKVELYESAEGIAGRIIELDNADAVDENNPDPASRSRRLVGTDIFSGFVPNASGTRWEGGTIYDPNNGSTYRCRLWLEDDGRTLKARGYIGMPMFGRTESFERFRLPGSQVSAD